MSKVLIIDNYDSFTFNLVQAIGALGAEVIVKRNDTLLSELVKVNPSHLVISPGPGNPSHAGVSKEAILHFASSIPILGVCLGLQVIGVMFGAKISRAPEPVHGQTEPIFHNGKGIFRGLSTPTTMARYHSLILRKEEWPSELEITAWTEEELIMGLRHREIPNLEAVQFHPESFMSTEGTLLLRNFLHVER